MPTAKPLAATLEMVSVVPGVELASPAIRSSHQAEMVSPDMQRRRTLAAVEKHGGHAAGIILTPREKCRRFINSLRWQSGQLLACIVDMSMLFADISIEDLSFALIDTITGLVLTVFVVDPVLPSTLSIAADAVETTPEWPSIFHFCFPFFPSIFST